MSKREHQQEIRASLERQLAARDLAAQALLRAAGVELRQAVTLSRQLAKFDHRRVIA